MNVKILQSHWLLLFVYFVVSSVFLLSGSGHHHTISILPIILLVLPLLLLFLPKLQQKYFAVTILLVFALLHVVPFIPMMQMHHQSQSLEQHPCCMPQVATVIVFFIISPLVSLLYKRKEIVPSFVVNPSFVLLSTRAPPRGF